MKVTTIGEFFDFFCNTKNLDAWGLLQYWKEEVPPAEWKDASSQPLSEETIINFRTQVSWLFAELLYSVSVEERYVRITKAHAAFIEEINDKAAEYGFIITEKRLAISPTEAFVDEGLARVVDGKVHFL